MQQYESNQARSDNAITGTQTSYNPGLLMTGRQVWLRIPMYRPMFTLGILGLIAAVYVLQVIFGPDFDGQYLKSNAPIVQGEWWRLITATFMHANINTGHGYDPSYIVHILSNSYGIFIIGQQVEMFFGRWRFLSIYMLSGLAGSVASFAFSQEDSLGASGALFGLIGALGVYYWFNRRLMGAQGRAQLWNVLFIVVLNLLFGLSQSQAIDNWGHIGGLLGGLAVGSTLLPRYRPGREIGVDERLLEDSSPKWLPAVASAALFLVIAGFFLVAWVQQGGHI